MMRQAGPADQGALATFLNRHLESSMFLLSNLEAHGTQEREHPHGTRYFLRDGPGGVTGVFALTNGGMLLVQCARARRGRGGGVGRARVGHPAQRSERRGEAIGCAAGRPGPARRAFSLNAVEPLYAHDLANLPASGPMRRVEAADVPLLTAWFAAYMEETRTAPPGPLRVAAARRARAAVDGAPAGGAVVRLLIEDGAPVATAAVNATAGDAVQVGGVYMPPALRGAGRAGRAVALLLSERAVQGTRRAVLFAGSEGAARAYERIGFVRVGEYRLSLFHSPVTLEAAP